MFHKLVAGVKPVEILRGTEWWPKREENNQIEVQEWWIDAPSCKVIVYTHSAMRDSGDGKHVLDSTAQNVQAPHPTNDNCIGGSSVEVIV